MFSFHKLAAIVVLLSLTYIARCSPSEPTEYWTKASSPCDSVPTNTLEVPKNSLPFILLNTTGVRIWKCVNGTLDQSQSDAAGNVTNNLRAQDWEGTQKYEGEVAVWDLKQKDTNKAFQFRSDPTNTYPGHTVLVDQPDALAWGRWFVDNFTATYESPKPSYVTRTNTTGGVTPPTQCPSNVTEVQVPYTGVFILYYCPPRSAAFRVGYSSSYAASLVLLSIFFMTLN